MKTKARFLKRMAIPAVFLCGLLACGGAAAVVYPYANDALDQAVLFSSLLGEPEGGVYIARSEQEQQSLQAAAEGAPVQVETHFPPDAQPDSFDPFAPQGEPAELAEPTQPPPEPENPVPIVQERFSSTGSGEMYLKYGSGTIKNTSLLTAEEVRKELESRPDLTIQKNGDPQVLIIHTHATESYEPYDRETGEKGYSARSRDNSQNVTAVGDIIAEELNRAGFKTLHDKTQHDYPSYNGAYDRMKETITRYLEKYPSIQIVLDIHRDAIEREGGARVKPVAEIGGKKAAQIMICVGSGSDTAHVPDYMHNLRFGAMLQDQVQADYDGLARPLFLCARNYNLHLSKGSLLIEMGGHANTLEEAKYSGELLGKSLVKTLEKLMPASE